MNLIGYASEMPVRGGLAFGEPCARKEVWLRLGARLVFGLEQAYDSV
ncbi:MAG: hypothetical protein IID36_14800 [Planctomycetes bacterium]|nr:hypothetical protein [Planctomycetota bacterium]